jgi:hypothetical protein
LQISVSYVLVPCRYFLGKARFGVFSW